MLSDQADEHGECYHHTTVSADVLQAITYKERAQFYKTEYATVVDQAFLQSLVTDDVHSILEIPAGAGRNLSWLSATGRSVVVADREAAMVEQLSVHIQTIGAVNHIQAVVADMCELSLERTFDLILVPQGAFQLLPGPEDALRALNGFRRHLAQNGHLLIDLATFQASDVCGDKHIRPSYYDPTVSNGQCIAEWTRVLPRGGTLARSRVQDRQEEILITRFYYIFQYEKEQKKYLSFLMKSRIYSYEQFLALVRQTCLIPRSVYRNYSCDPYISVGHRMIFLLECGQEVQ